MARKQLSPSEQYDRAREAELRAELRELAARRELTAAEEALRKARQGRELAYRTVQETWDKRESA